MSRFPNHFSPFLRASLAPMCAWLCGMASLLLVSTGLVFYTRNWATPEVAEKFYPTEPVGGVAFAILGILVVTRLPRNRVGWLFLSISLSAALALFTDQYTIYALTNRSAALPWVGFIAWLQGWVWLIGNWAIGMLPLIFPTGRLLSPRWRWVTWLLTFSAGAFAGLIFVVTWGMTAPQLQQFGTEQLSPLQQTLGDLLTLAMFGCYIAAALSLWVRLRRARGVERQQMKWFTFAVVLLVLSVVVANVAEDLWTTPWIEGASKGVQALFLAGMAVAIAIAILQHRLFDIDLIIRRTLLYTLLSLLLALLYWGSVIVLENFFHGLSGQGQNTFVTVISTLAIASLFTPLRRRVQEMIDRRFYRRKYDAELVLAKFAETVRNETDLQQLREQLLAVTQETMQPTQLSLWLKPIGNETRE